MKVGFVRPTDMMEDNPAGANDIADSQRDFPETEPPVLYRQISYEELEECVFIVRDSISEFYLAPQGEISIAAVEAALKRQTDIDPPFHERDAGNDFSYNGDTVFNGLINEKSFISELEAPDFAERAAGVLDADANDAVSGAGSRAAGTGGDEEINDADGLNEANVIDAFGVIGGADSTIDAVNISGANGTADAEYANAAEDITAGVATGVRKSYRPRPHIRHIYRESIKGREKKRRAITQKYLIACFAGAVSGALLALVSIAWVLPSFGFVFSPSNPGDVHEVIHTYEYAKADSQIEAIYEKISPSVVGIRVTTAYGGYIFGRQTAFGEGSGIIIHADGFILTSNRVIEATSPDSLTLPGSGGAGSEESPKLEVVIKSDPDTVYNARIITRDAKTDIAIIKIDAANLPVAELGDSDQLKPGEMVIAIGGPNGIGAECTVTDGIISGLNRNANANADGYANLIQTSAAINPGNSGGALVNAKGQVIGVNVIAVDSSGYGGVNFAVPINSTLSVTTALIDTLYTRARAKTGIKSSEAFDLNYDFYKRQYPDIPKGVYVEYVEPLSGAFTAGIMAGDIITKMRGETVAGYLDMLAIKAAFVPGDFIEVEVFRAGEYLFMTIEVSEGTDEDTDDIY